MIERDSTRDALDIAVTVVKAGGTAVGAAAVSVFGGVVASELLKPPPPAPVTITNFECADGGPWGLVKRADGSEIAGSRMDLVPQPDGGKTLAVLQGDIFTRPKGAKSFDRSEFITRTTAWDNGPGSVCRAQISKTQVYPGHRPR